MSETNELNKALFGGKRVIGMFPHYQEQVIRKADFEESEHPRGEDGKFAPGGAGGSGASAEAPKPAAEAPKPAAEERKPAAGLSPSATFKPSGFTKLDAKDHGKVTSGLDSIDEKLSLGTRGGLRSAGKKLIALGEKYGHKDAVDAGGWLLGRAEAGHDEDVENGSYAAQADSVVTSMRRAIRGGSGGEGKPAPKSEGVPAVDEAKKAGQSVSDTISQKMKARSPGLHPPPELRLVATDTKPGRTSSLLSVEGRVPVHEKPATRMTFRSSTYKGTPAHQVVVSETREEVGRLFPNHAIRVSGHPQEGMFEIEIEPKD